MADYIISGGTVVTMNADRDIIKAGAVVLEGDKIKAVGPDRKIRRDYSPAGGTVEIIDAAEKIVFPGLINTHVHSFQTLLKGLETDTGLDRWLTNVITPSVAEVNEQEAYYGAVLSGLDALRSGTTTVTDYQYAQHMYELNPAVVKGFRDLGLRLVFARGFADTGVQFGANPAELESIDVIDDGTRRLVREYPGDESRLIMIALAPSAVWMCTPELLEWAAAFSREYGLLVTSHIAETDYDNECSVAVHGRGDFGACEQHGLINERMLMVHCVRLREEDVRRAAEKGAAFSYNPVSNMYLASGAAPLREILRHGLTGSFGTDGAASNNSNDMLETMKAGILQAKSFYRDPQAFTAMNALEYAAISGARALGLEDQIGSIETGKKADLFIFNPSASAKSTPCHEPVAGLAYASDSRNIETVFVNGRPVLLNNTVTGLHERTAIQAAGEAARRLVERMRRSLQL
jgi:5-methylthioadenosine/S-adenosylhomocysteine deaminase